MPLPLPGRRSAPPLTERPVVGLAPRLERYRAIAASWSWHPEYAAAIERGDAGLGGIRILTDKPRTIPPSGGTFAYPSAHLLLVLQDAWHASGADPDDLPAVARVMAEHFPREDNAEEVATFTRARARDRFRDALP